MKKGDEIESVNLAGLSWHCIAPVILRIRGKNEAIKNEEYQRLNEGQKAIFSFHVYYEHAKNDIDSFVYWNQLYLKNKFFIDIKNGAHYFSHPDYSKILTEIEKACMDNSNNGLRELYERFLVIGEEHKIRMGKRIEANKEYFYSYQ